METRTGWKVLMFGGEWRDEHRSLWIGVSEEPVGDLATSSWETAWSSQKTREFSSNAWTRAKLPQSGSRCEDCPAILGHCGQSAGCCWACMWWWEEEGVLAVWWWWSELFLPTPAQYASHTEAIAVLAPNSVTARTIAASLRCNTIFTILGAKYLRN